MMDHLKNAVGLGADSLDLTIGEAFDLLRNHRRREVLRYVVANADGTGHSLDDLSRALAVLETDDVDRPENVPPQARKRVYVSLYQTHLPQLADAGAVEWGMSDPVHPTPVASSLIEFLDDAGDTFKTGRGVTVE